MLVVSKLSAGEYRIGKLEKAARQARNGLWADPQAAPLWELRKK